jgi:hypothetical protein
MLKNVPIACLLTVVAIVPLAHAQLSKGPNGGIVATSQGHPIELVLKGQEIVFYLRDDDGSALATKDMLGRATIQEGGERSWLRWSLWRRTCWRASWRVRSGRRPASCSRPISAVALTRTR